MLEPHEPALLPTPSSRGFGGAVFLTLFVVLAAMACLKYLALHSTVFDLGVFLSNLYSLHTAGQWWRAFLGHAQPLLPLYAQVYRLAPDQAAPLALLTIQALALSLPALWAARRYGLLAALAYALYFPVWTNALFDFHLDHLLIPILFAFLIAATSERYRLACILGLLPALVKEPYALTTVFCGLYLWLVARRSRAGWGLITFGALYFFVTTTWVIPFCTADPGLGAESGAYAWLGGGPGAALATLVSHPANALGVMFGVPGKWKYLGFLFGSLLFFPLFRPKFLLPAIPTLALALLATKPNYYGWANHYTAGAAGVLFFAFCEVLGPVRILAGQSGAGARRFGLAIFLALGLGHVLLAPSPLSRLFLMTDNFAFSIEAYEPTARDAGILSAILKSVPNDPTVPVVSQNSLNWGSLAERLDYNSFPLGVFAPHPVRDLSKATWKDFWIFIRTGQTPNLPVRAWQAGYVLLDLTRPWFVLDRGCEYQNGTCQDETVANAFNTLVIRARQELETVSDQDGFLILRRPQPVAPPAPVTPPPAAPAQGAPAQGGTEAPTASQPPVTPTPAPGVSQPTPQAPTPQAPASTASPAEPTVQPDQDLGTSIEVEVLDRFPSQRHGKKGKAEVPPQGAEQPGQSVQQPAVTVPPTGPQAPQDAPVVSPDAQAPATETPKRPTRRSRRQKEPAAPADQTGQTGQPAQPNQSGQSGQPNATVQPTGPQAPQDAPVVSPDAQAPATETPKRPTRRSRRHKEPAAPADQTGQTGQPAQPNQSGQSGQPDATVQPTGQQAPQAAPVVTPDTQAPTGEAPKRPTRRSRRHKEPVEIPAPAQPSTGTDNVP